VQEEESPIPAKTVIAETACRARANNRVGRIPTGAPLSYPFASPSKAYEPDIKLHAPSMDGSMGSADCKAGNPL
jgi:hypothetical protein